MRYLLILWAVPLALFWSWYALSVNDLNFGSIYLSRQLHDMVFAVYAQTLGVAPETIPPMIAWACIVDTGIIGAIAAFRWRAAWWPQTRLWAIDFYRSQFDGGSDAEPDQGLATIAVPVLAETEALTDRQYGPARPAE